MRATLVMPKYIQPYRQSAFPPSQLFSKQHCLSPITPTTELFVDLYIPNPPSLRVRRCQADPQIADDLLGTLQAPNELSRRRRTIGEKTLD